MPTARDGLRQNQVERQAEESASLYAIMRRDDSDVFQCSPHRRRRLQASHGVGGGQAVALFLFLIAGVIVDQKSDAKEQHQHAKPGPHL